MAQFNSSRYEIFTHRQPQRDDQSPFAPASPERTVSPVGIERPQFQKLAVAGVGVAIAKQVTGSVIQEIEDTTGNNRFATAFSNTQSLVSIAVLAKSAGLAGVAVAAGDAIVKEIINQRARQREIANTRYESKLNGARLRVGNLGSRNYYD